MRITVTTRSAASATGTAAPPARRPLPSRMPRSMLAVPSRDATRTNGSDRAFVRHRQTRVPRAAWLPFASPFARWMNGAPPNVCHMPFTPIPVPPRPSSPEPTSDEWPLPIWFSTPACRASSLPPVAHRPNGDRMPFTPIPAPPPPPSPPTPEWEIPPFMWVSTRVL